MHRVQRRVRFAHSVVDGATARARFTAGAFAEASAPLRFGGAREIQIELNGRLRFWDLRAIVRKTRIA